MSAKGPNARDGVGIPPTRFRQAVAQVVTWRLCTSSVTDELVRGNVKSPRSRQTSGPVYLLKAAFQGPRQVLRLQ